MPMYRLWLQRVMHDLDVRKRSLNSNTLRPRKIAAIFQTRFSDTFSWMKTYKFRESNWQYSIIGSDNAETSHYLNQWLLVYWRIYPSLGLNELNHSRFKTDVTGIPDTGRLGFQPTDPNKKL